MGEVRRIKPKFGIASLVFTTDSTKIIVSDVDRGNLKTSYQRLGMKFGGRI
ncbi:MAG: hypothetical protein WA421_01430 [Nitrososphaeraceae archaeon]